MGAGWGDREDRELKQRGMAEAVRGGEWGGTRRVVRIARLRRTRYGGRWEGRWGGRRRRVGYVLRGGIRASYRWSGFRGGRRSSFSIGMCEGGWSGRCGTSGERSIGIGIGGMWSEGGGPACGCGA